MVIDRREVDMVIDGREIDRVIDGREVDRVIDIVARYTRALIKTRGKPGHLYRRDVDRAIVIGER